MRAVRAAGGAVLALYGASYLWLAPAAAGGGAGGPLWTMVEVLVIATAAGFMVAGWGLARSAPWAERMTIGAAAAGLLTLAPYLAAVPGLRAGDPAANAALHGLGSSAILLALSIRPAERTLSRRLLEQRLPGRRPLASRPLVQHVPGRRLLASRLPGSRAQDRHRPARRPLGRHPLSRRARAARDDRKFP